MNCRSVCHACVLPVSCHNWNAFIGSRHAASSSTSRRVCKTPIISTDVGLASLFLPNKSIFVPGEELSAEPDSQYCYDKVKEKFIKSGFDDFINMFT